MYKGKTSGYHYKIYDRKTDDLLLEGDVTGGNKRECQNAVYNIIGWNYFRYPEKYKLCMKANF